MKLTQINGKGFQTFLAFHYLQKQFSGKIKGLSRLDLLIERFSGFENDPLIAEVQITIKCLAPYRSHEMEGIGFCFEYHHTCIWIGFLAFSLSSLLFAVGCLLIIIQEAGK